MSRWHGWPTFTGVYGLSFEIMIVNVAVATAFLVRREKRQLLLVAAFAAAAVLQCGQFIPTPAVPTDRSALLVQPNIPILEGSEWTKDYFDATLRVFSPSVSSPFWSSPRFHCLAGIARALL